MLCTIAAIAAAWQPSPLAVQRCSHSPSANRPAVTMAGFGGGATKKPAAKKGKKGSGASAGSFQGQKTFMAQWENYKELRAKDSSNQVDVFVRAEATDKFWFVGKAVAREGTCDDAGLAVLAQKRAVLEHAKLLVGELKLARTPLQLWAAPPNSEMAVAQKQQPLRPLDGLPKPAEPLTLADCGFEPEQYLDPAQGLYVRLGDDGAPTSGPVEAKIVSAQELAEMNLDLSDAIGSPEAVNAAGGA